MAQNTTSEWQTVSFPKRKKGPITDRGEGSTTTKLLNALGIHVRIFEAGKFLNIQKLKYVDKISIHSDNFDNTKNTSNVQTKLANTTNEAQDPLDHNFTTNDRPNNLWHIVSIENSGFPNTTKPNHAKHSYHQPSGGNVSPQKSPVNTNV